MDQEFDARRISPVRLALGAAGAVFGGFLLSLALGSAPAHADENPTPEPGLLTQLVTTVATPVSAIVTPVAATVAPVVAPVAAVAAPVTTPVAELVTPVAAATASSLVHVTQSSPVTALTGSLLKPLTQPIDDDLAGVAPALAPVVKALDPVLTVIAPPLTTIGQALSPTQDANTFGPITAAENTARALAYALPALVATAASGVASGLLDFGDSPAQSGGVASLSAGGSVSPSLLLGAFGAGMILLLALARRRNSGDALPASPVYETDSSPD